MVIASAILFSIFSLAFFSRSGFSLPLLSVLIMLFLTSKNTAMMWTITIGIMLEMVSPYPTFTYLFALLVTVLLA